jgi:signal transduction histidine kinase
VAIGAVALGLAVLAQHLVGGSVLFWPVLLGVVGLAVLWRQADEAQRERWVDSSGRINLQRAVVGSGGKASYARLAAGIGLLLSALVLFALQTGTNGQLGVARDVVLAGVLGVAGLALMVGPWLFRLVGDLSEERAARVRSQERADMAAHLHDSVLQTLALIQKHAGDGRTVATLARAQERDLRTWLYGDRPPAGTSLAGALREAAAEVEDSHNVPVEVVVVGDAPVSERLHPVVLAAREAMVNAARHSGADQVDVYAECGVRSVDVFVRDRGRGFDEDVVAEDRYGVRSSIKERMQRHGGSAEVRTAPGEGTEVRLSMTIEGTDEEES